MFQLSEEFFHSLGMRNMTRTFWNRSILERPIGIEMIWSVMIRFDFSFFFGFFFIDVWVFENRKKFIRRRFLSKTFMIFSHLYLYSFSLFFSFLISFVLSHQKPCISLGFF